MTDRTLSELAHEACMLTGYAEGISVLEHEACGPDYCPMAKRARNALPVAIDMLVDRMRALNDAIEAADNKAMKEARQEKAKREDDSHKGA